LIHSFERPARRYERPDCATQRGFEVPYLANILQLAGLGQKQKSRSAKGTSGLPPKADIIAEAKEVRFGPQADMSHQLLHGCWHPRHIRNRLHRLTTGPASAGLFSTGAVGIGHKAFRSFRFPWDRRFIGAPYLPKSRLKSAQQIGANRE
jgi:hypothetical protein